MLLTLGVKPKLGGMGRYRYKRDRLHKFPLADLLMISLYNRIQKGG